MRCKPGDLAVILRAEMPENIGRLVLVLEQDWWEPEAWVVEMASGRPAPTRNEWSGMVGSHAKAYILDCNLRPIRDTDGADEMLRDLPYQVAHA